jgi:uncharacterized protein RhaS with RHS repeats
LNHNGFRDYEAGGGRSIQPDPIGLEGGITAYGYVSSNPLMNIDPNGLTTTTASNSGLTFPEYGRPMPAPRLVWDVRIMGACRVIAGVSAGQLAVGVVAALYPSSTSACDTITDKPSDCPVYIQKEDPQKRINRCENNAVSRAKKLL